jgi:hypothetical protein
MYERMHKRIKQGNTRKIKNNNTTVVPEQYRQYRVYDSCILASPRPTPQPGRHPIGSHPGMSGLPMPEVLVFSSYLRSTPNGIKFMEIKFCLTVQSHLHQIQYIHMAHGFPPSIH